MTRCWKRWVGRGRRGQRFSKCVCEKERVHHFISYNVGRRVFTSLESVFPFWPPSPHRTSLVVSWPACSRLVDGFFQPANPTTSQLTSSQDKPPVNPICSSKLVFLANTFLTTKLIITSLIFVKFTLIL